VEFAQLPVLPGAAELAKAGFVTGASGRNWTSYGQDVTLFDGCADWQQAILTDPQTSGGLLVSCASGTVEEVMGIFRRHGFERAAIIGALEPGPAGVVLSGI
jgi:selenide,water dikinase